MPQYSLLRRRIPDVAQRSAVITRLQRLITQLDRDIPSKDSDRNLLLATWNIRDLAKTNRRGFGERLPETHFYIAEILSRFDFVAVQEVNELDEWHDIMDILGPDWDFIATDVSHAKLGGNGERLLYAFDRRKVRFQKIAGEIVLPSDMLISAGVQGEEAGYQGKQFRRSPFMARFQSNWFKFDICTVHIYYGKESGPALQERIQEIDRVAEYLAELAKKEAQKKQRATILLGDFNIVSPQHQTMAALKRHGFRTAAKLDRPVNLDHSKYYDQIAFLCEDDVIAYVDRDGDPANAGVFEIFESIFRDPAKDAGADFTDYIDAARATPNGDDKPDDKLPSYYASWKTYQLSDHKPIWVRLNANDAEAYLRKLAAGGDD